MRYQPESRYYNSAHDIAGYTVARELERQGRRFFLLFTRKRPIDRSRETRSLTVRGEHYRVINQSADRPVGRCRTKRRHATALRRTTPRGNFSRVSPGLRLPFVPRRKSPGFPGFVPPVRKKEKTPREAILPTTAAQERGTGPGFV